MIAWTHDIAWINSLYKDELHEGYPWDVIRREQPGVRYVCISHTRRTELLRLWVNEPPARSPDVIPNGVDLATVLRISAPIAHWAAKTNVFDREFVMLLPVRITRRKNIELAIDVAAQLIDSGINAALVITGPTHGHHPHRAEAYLNELKNRAASLKIEKHVRFAVRDMGRVLSNREIYELYDLADILLLPSQSEGFGLPILEAGLHRMPLALSDLPVF